MSIISHEGFVLYSIEVNVDGAHAPSSSCAPFSRARKNADCLFLYLLISWGKGKEEFIKPAQKKDVTFSVLPRAESRLK